MSSSRPGDGRAAIGVFALQGDFHAHGRVLERLGVAWRKIVAPEDFQDLRGLIIPGGESTTFLKLLTPSLKEKILEFAARGGAIYGSCAGAILLARKVLNPEQATLGLLDAVLVRNGYGRQGQSFVLRRDGGEVEGEEAPSEMVFIRAPLIEEIGPGVRVLARARGSPVYVQEGRILVTTFHPELTGDPSIHIRFTRTAEAPIP